MSESKKGASTAGNPKEKDSILDLDFGNNFLTSWKTTSITGDDAMDLDFGPMSKGIKKAFEFKKGDMDFNLDDDFGKMPSFDLGFSSPIKKDANSKKKHEEESTTGNNEAKADRFSFTFDFDDLDSFSFKSSPKKLGVKEKKDATKENSLDISGSKEFADHTPEENESTKTPSTQGKAVLITSSFVSQIGNAAATGTITGNHLSNTNEKAQLKSTTTFVKTSAYEELTTFDQTINTDRHNSDSQQHNVSPEQVSPEACILREPALDVSAITISATEPGREDIPKVQEDVDSVYILINQGDKQCFDKNEKDNSFSSSVSPVHGDPSSQYGLSPHNANDSVPNSVDVHISVGKKDEPKHTQIESPSSESSASVVLKELAPSKLDQVKAQNLLDHSSVTVRNAVSANNLMPEKEKVAVTVRSKYFKAADKSGDQLHNSLTQRKLSSLTEKKIVDRQQHRGDERHGNAKEDQNNSMIPDKSLARLESRVCTEHSDKESQEASQSLFSSGPLSEDTNKVKLVSRGRESNAKTLDSIKLTGQAEKLRSETLAPKVMSEKIKPSLTKIQSPNLSSSRTSRPTGTSTNGSKPPPRDAVKSSTLNQNRVLIGVKPSKTTAPPIHSLKRKRVESPNTNIISKSPKHLFPSPVLRQIEENPTDYIDEEALGNKNNVGNGKMYTPNSLKSWEANRIELEVPYSMEKDDNVEKAEAITKELDNICNMLRKKHEEVKEILVRAIVSNNKLLMLNHPMHDEKIRMVQRFAKQLTLKEIDTQT